MAPLVPVAAGVAFTYGYGKARALNAQGGGRTPLPRIMLDAAIEEAAFRLGLERMLLRRTLNIGETSARIAQAIAFALIHPGRELETAVAGYLYSWLYEKAAQANQSSDLHGFLASTAAHTAHNLGVIAGAK